MSNIYITEPPTSGKILLTTSKGDIEIDLWAKETPKACRNIIALAMEGYFDDMIWHRVVPGFCIQTGDPSGTGTGGESYYGEPFQDEPHQRLKFTRRGLVAMANPGERDHNESQFFITLDATPELQNKHTIFGKVSGSTIFNVLSLAEVELSESEPDRPVFPPKLLSVKVIDNPFDDIVPRITREEKLAQVEAKRRAKQESGQRREKTKKNTGLLSFGEAEEESTATDPRFKGAKSSHDLLKGDRRLRKESAAVAGSARRTTGLQDRGTASNAESSTRVGKEAESQRRGPSNDSKITEARSVAQDAARSIDLSRLREEHEQSTGAKNAAKEIQELEASIRGLTKRGSSSDRPGDGERRKKLRRGKELLEQAKAKYASATTGSGRERLKPEAKESETMKLLRKFQSDRSAKGQGHNLGDAASAERDTLEKAAEVEYEDGMREYGASDDDDDGTDGASWRSHRFDYGGRSINEDKYTADTYVTLDSRDTSSSAAAMLGFGSGDTQKRVKQEELRKDGRRGRDWVDERSERPRGHHDRERRRESEAYRGGRQPQSARDRHTEAPQPRDLERW